MTDKELKLAIKALDMTVRKIVETGEYRVNFVQPIGTEATSYYTDDKEDALNTAKAMIQHSRNTL